MTVEEFSNEFDVLINSHSSINNFGSTASPIQFDEYEKSVLLTEAQEDIIRGLYNGKLNTETFEQTEELRRYLDNLIKTDLPTPISKNTGLDENSKFFKTKDDVWFITYESVELANGAYCDSDTIEVIPVRQDEWHRIRKNPFKRPNKRRVVRLDNSDNTLELISQYPIKKYLIRYLSKPTPIILVKLEGDLSIDNTQEVTECKLNPVLHRLILLRAIELANRRLSRASN